MGAFFEQHKRFHIILHRMEWGLNQDAYPATAACAPEMKREIFLRMEKLMQPRRQAEGAAPRARRVTTPTS